MHARQLRRGSGHTASKMTSVAWGKWTEHHGGPVSPQRLLLPFRGPLLAFAPEETGRPTNSTRWDGRKALPAQQSYPAFGEWDPRLCGRAPWSIDPFAADSTGVGGREVLEHPGGTHATDAIEPAGSDRARP